MTSFYLDVSTKDRSQHSAFLSLAFTREHVFGEDGRTQTGEKQNGRERGRKRRRKLENLNLLVVGVGKEETTRGEMVQAVTALYN